MRERPGRVVGLAGAQAVVQLAEHAVEQVPQRSGVTVTAVAAAQIVLLGWEGRNAAVNAQE